MKSRLWIFGLVLAVLPGLSCQDETAKQQTEPDKAVVDDSNVVAVVAGKPISADPPEHMVEKMRALLGEQALQEWLAAYPKSGIINTVSEQANQDYMAKHKMAAPQEIMDAAYEYFTSRISDTGDAAQKQRKLAREFTTRLVNRWAIDRVVCKNYAGRFRVTLFGIEAAEAYRDWFKDLEVDGTVRFVDPEVKQTFYDGLVLEDAQSYLIDLPPEQVELFMTKPWMLWSESEMKAFVEAIAEQQKDQSK